MNTKMESQEDSRKFEKQERANQFGRRKRSFRHPRWHYGQQYAEPVWHHQGWLRWQNDHPPDTQKFRPGGIKPNLMDISNTSPELKQTLSRATMVPLFMLVLGLSVILFHLNMIWDFICANLFPMETQEGVGR